MLHRLLLCFVSAAIILLCACQGYDFRVNDKIVYSPTPLFSDFTTEDEALTGCLEQAINDGAITAADQLIALDCSFAGIENLEGLSTFTSLIALRLSANKVRNLLEISKLVTLEQLYLDDNQIIDPVPLYPLRALLYVDLSSNPALQCPSKGVFEHVETVLLPQHCR